jgi:hypothetical protein
VAETNLSRAQAQRPLRHLQALWSETMSKKKSAKKSMISRIKQAALGIMKPIKRGQGKPSINREVMKQLKTLELKPKKGKK